MLYVHLLLIQNVISIKCHINNITIANIISSYYFNSLHC